MNERRRRSLGLLLLLLPVIAALFWLTAILASDLPTTALFAVNLHGPGSNNYGGSGVLRPAPLSLSVLDDARMDAQTAEPAPSVVDVPSSTPTPAPTQRPTATPRPSPTATPTSLPTVVPSPSLTPLPTPTLPVITPTPTAGTGTISGQVLDSQTKSPIAGATAALSPGGAIAISDANGNFSFTVAPATYTVTVSAVSYSSASQSATVKGGQKVTLTFKLTSVTTFGSITGTVVDSITQAPVVGATVSLSNGLVRVTDVNGNFSYAIVLSGSYTLKVSALNYVTQSQPVSVKPGHTTNVQINLVHS